MRGGVGHCGLRESAKNRDYASVPKSGFRYAASGVHVVASDRRRGPLAPCSVGVTHSSLFGPTGRTASVRGVETAHLEVECAARPPVGGQARLSQVYIHWSPGRCPIGPGSHGLSPTARLGRVSSCGSLPPGLRMFHVKRLDRCSGLSMFHVKHTCGQPGQVLPEGKLSSTTQTRHRLSASVPLRNECRGTEGLAVRVAGDLDLNALLRAQWFVSEARHGSGPVGGSLLPPNPAYI